MIVKMDGGERMEPPQRVGPCPLLLSLLILGVKYRYVRDIKLLLLLSFSMPIQLAVVWLRRLDDWLDLFQLGVVGVIVPTKGVLSSQSQRWC